MTTDADGADWPPIPSLVIYAVPRPVPAQLRDLAQFLEGEAAGVDDDARAPMLWAAVQLRLIARRESGRNN